MIKKIFLVDISFQPVFPVSIFRVNTISTMDKSLHVDFIKLLLGR